MEEAKSKFSKKPSYGKIASVEKYYCGLWSYQPQWLRRFGVTKYFVLVYALVAITQGMEYSYKSATLEPLRRFNINEELAGVVFVGNEVSQIVFSVILGYVSITGKCHRPRWIAAGVFLSALASFLMAGPHFIYGPGADFEADMLTKRDHVHPLQSSLQRNSSHIFSNTFNSVSNSSSFESQMHQLCISPPMPAFFAKDSDEHDDDDDSNSDEDDYEVNTERPSASCVLGSSSILTMFIIVLSEAIAGVSGLLVYSLGSPYLEESLMKTQSPAVFGITMSAGVFGPLLGYRMASACLKMLPAVTVTTVAAAPMEPDSRIGAWWLGWLVLGALLAIVSFLMSMFPKYLPKPAKYRQIENKSTESIDFNSNSQESITANSDTGQISVISSTYPSSTDLSICSDNSTSTPNSPAFSATANSTFEYTKIVEKEPTFRDNLQKLRREMSLLLRNKTLVFNNLSSLFFVFASTGYWMYMPEYLETVFSKTAEDAAFISGIVGIVSQGVGLLGCGWLISKFQPSARFLAGWNVFIGILYVLAKVVFTQLKCQPGDYNFLENAKSANPIGNCSLGCACEDVDYAPLCDRSTNQVYFSACHAGCTSVSNGSFGNCSCISMDVQLEKGVCIQEGCNTMLLIFLVISGLLSFSEACGRIGNVLVAYRCVHPRKKGLSICLNIALHCVFAYLPAPFLFKYIFESTCILRGTTAANRTCGTKGPCWLYSGDKLRYIYNLTAAGIILVGAILDGFVWHYVKNLDLYDDKKNIERRETKRRLRQKI